MGGERGLMMKRTVLLIVTLFLCLTFILAVIPGVAGQSLPDDARVFPTRFVVQGEFLAFFDSHGGIEVFGYPLTIEFEEEGRRVQYFHRGRMELHAENSPEQQVMLGPLGALLVAPEPPLAEPPSRPDQQFFPETGHSVMAAFLRYFEARGGADFFGYPITEMMVENGRIVQYFERARLEWHPDNPPGLRVQLGRLGEIYLDRFLPSSEERDPESGSSQRILPPPVTALQVAPSVSHSYAGQNQPQALYVFVYDQVGVPLAGAQVQAVIHLPDGDREIAMNATNELGLSWQVFEVGPVPVGEKVVVDVVVRYGRVEGRTQVSFLIWL